MSKEVMPTPVDWSLAQVWNEVAMKEEKPLKKRDYVYASELGQPMCDRVLKMNAVPMTNPPNARSRRKFLAGNLLEYVVKQILIAAGFYVSDEVKIDGTPYKGLLDVHGRCDFKTIHGYINIGAALTRLYELHLPEDLYRIGEKIIRSIEGVYLLGKILELKSCSSFLMEKLEKTKLAIPTHSLQAYHYQKNGGLPAQICYVCKDDMRMQQFAIDAVATEKLYKEDLTMITDYYKKGKTPPIEPLAMFNSLTGKFEKNLGVEYSPYLTMLYNFKNPEEYRDSVKFVKRWNDTVSRYVKMDLGHKTPTGKALTETPLNKETRAIISQTFDFDYIINCAKAAGIAEEEEAADF